jgi:hypothetical protein
MKRGYVLLVMAMFLFGSVFFVGCGGQGKKVNGVAEEQSEVMQEGAQKGKEELPTTYVVEKGDKLWDIAAKSEIYGNKEQWPLIYDANRDILDSYNKLEEGQKLIIPRNVSAQDIEAATKRAEELGLPPKEKGAEEGIQSGKVAGLGKETAREKAGAKVAARVEKAVAAATAVTNNEETMPTPVPEPQKARAKNGGMNPVVLVVLLLLVAGAVVMFIYFQKKKKEEEDEENKDDSNVLS